MRPALVLAACLSASVSSAQAPDAVDPGLIPYYKLISPGIAAAGQPSTQALPKLAAARERIDAVLHCAARSLVGQSLADPALYYRDNVAGGIALLEAMRRAGTGRLVFSSTAAVYGIPGSTPITEDAPLRPINPYGETKRTLEGALGWYAAAYGLRSVSLRYFNVAGATERLGEIHDPETHLIPTILRAAEGRIDLTIFGRDYPTRDGTNIRDYIDVSDLADAHLLALEATDPGDTRTGGTDEPGRALAFNLGNGDGEGACEVHNPSYDFNDAALPYGASFFARLVEKRLAK